MRAIDARTTAGLSCRTSGDCAILLDACVAPFERVLPSSGDKRAFGAPQVFGYSSADNNSHGATSPVCTRSIHEAAHAHTRSHAFVSHPSPAGRANRRTGKRLSSEAH